MKTKNAFLFGSLLLIGFYSCKKEKDETPEPALSNPPAAANYYPLSSGSYWIYDSYKQDTNGVETYISTDSSYISNDTVIGANTYAVFHGSIFLPAAITYRRDSSGYIVDQYGKVYFSAANFSDTLRIDTVPGLFYSYAKMLPATSVSVAAGTFSAYDCGLTTNIVQPGYPWDTTRYTHHYFADNVGLVMESAFLFTQPDYQLRKLVRYHIQ